MQLLTHASNRFFFVLNQNVPISDFCDYFNALSIQSNVTELNVFNVIFHFLFIPSRIGIIIVNDFREMHG